MKLYKITFIFALNTAGMLALAAPDLTSHLPAGSHKAEILQAGVDPKAQSLVEKLKKALQNNPALTQELAQKAEPGQPLPFDPRLGLSKGDYETALSALQGIKFRSAGITTLAIKKTDNGYLISSPANPTFKKGIALNASTQELKMGSYTLSGPNHYVAGAGTPIPNEGYRWKKAEDPSKPARVEFTLAKLSEENGKCLIGITIQTMANGGTSERQLLKYDCN